METQTEKFLSEEEGRILLRIARDSLNEWVRNHRRVNVAEYPLTGALQEKHGAFVTLRRLGSLRGCIGYTANIEPLAETVRDNAINAATNDPRFSPVNPDELAEMEIEVSALTPGDTPESPFKRVVDLNEIEIGRDGLYLERPPFRGGILLPQVATEHHLTRDEFLTAVCRKAGYEDHAWEDPQTMLYRFSAQVFAEPKKERGETPAWGS